MSWIRLDDRFPDHPKVIGLSNEAYRLYIDALCYSNLQQTDGRLLGHVVSKLCDPIIGQWRGTEYERAAVDFARELVEVHLWENADTPDAPKEGTQPLGAFIIHDFFDFNLSKEDRSKLSKMRAKAGKKGGLTKAEKQVKQLAKSMADGRLATSKQLATTSSSKPLAACPGSPSPSPSPSPSVEELKNNTNTVGQAPRHARDNGLRTEALSVLEWLNDKAGKNFPSSEANLDFIRGRLKEGFLPEQLKAIVSRKVRESAEGEFDRKYLRPATLFNKTKFSQYVGELPKVKTDADHSL